MFPWFLHAFTSSWVSHTHLVQECVGLSDILRTARRRKWHEHIRAELSPACRTTHGQAGSEQVHVAVHDKRGEDYKAGGRTPLPPTDKGAY